VAVPGPSKVEAYANLSTSRRVWQRRLVKSLDGKIKLICGSWEDQAAARQRCSPFLHEAAVACAG
jgi:hypothetical protein